MTNDLEDLSNLLNLLTERKLTVAILTALQDGPLRYTDLHQVVSHARDDAVHNKTLSNTLTYLREHGLVERSVDEHSPDYRLTTGSAVLIELLWELKRWTAQHRNADGH